MIGKVEGAEGMATAEVIQTSARAGRGGLASAPRVPFVGSLPMVVWFYLLGVIFPLYFYAGSLSLSPLRVVLLLMVVPATIGVFSGKAGRVLPTDWLLVLFIVWATVTMMINNPKMVVQNMGSNGIELLGGYMIGRLYIRTPEQFMALCRALIVIVIGLFPFMIYETLTGDPIILSTIRKIPGFFTAANVNVDKRMNLERVQSVFSHPIHHGLFCSIVFSLVFVAFRGVYTTAKRWLIAGVVGVAVFLSLSSGAFLAMVLQLGLIFWHFLFRNNDRKWTILLALSVVAYVTVDLLSNRTPIKVFMSYATFSPHTAYWRSLIFEWGMVNVWANPIIGLGLNNWVRPNWMNSGSMDNFWLVMAVRHGIPGFLLIAAAYADVVRRVGFRDFRNDPSMMQIRLAWMFIFCGLSFTLSTVHIWTAVFSFVFFFLGAGVWMVGFQPEAATASATPEPQQRERGTRFSREISSQDAGPRLTRDHSAAATGRTGPATPVLTRETAPSADPADRGTPKYTRFAQSSDDASDKRTGKQEKTR